jgi:hypothetical protein
VKLIFIILLFISTQLFSQTYRDTTQQIKLMFSELMSTEGLFDKQNYVVFSELGDTLFIYGIGVPEGTDTTGGIDNVYVVTEPFVHDLYHTTRVQWIKDLAGNLINENNYAFVTLPLIGSDPPPKNILIYPEDFTIGDLQVDTVWASGQEDSDHGPEKAVDGIWLTTPGSDYAYNCWTSCCLADPGGQWWVAGFNEPHFIQDITLSGTYWEGGRSYGLEIQISNDAQNWETVGVTFTLSNIEWSSYTIGRQAKFIRIEFLSNNQSTWAGLWEVEFTGN